jgi:uncharacterized protein YgbK (DUF1537 family)
MRLPLRRLRWGILADDLTGACDTAAAFAQSGLTATVVLDLRSRRRLGAELLVLSTHSRHDDPASARRKVRRACAWLRARRHPVLFKKIDSTLQGNIVAEVESLRDAAGFATALVCPANPAQGRVVRGGVLWVRGNAHRDLRRSFREQGLREFVSLEGPLAKRRVQAALELGSPFILAGAATEQDLLCLVEAALGARPKVLLAGSAALAATLARFLSRRSRPVAAGVPPAVEPGVPPGGGTAGEPGALDLRESRPGGKMPPSTAGGTPAATLVLSGSNNSVTRLQIAQLTRNCGAREFALLSQNLDDLHATLLSDRCAVLRVPVHGRPDREILRSLAGLAPLFRAPHIGGLVLIGGDTAQLVCRWLRPRGITIHGEMVPGLAWGRFIGGLADGLLVCTKPGGFGSSSSLLRAVKFLLGGRAANPSAP